MAGEKSDVCSSRSRRGPLKQSRLTALLALILHEHKQSKNSLSEVKLAHLYDTDDCSAYVRSRWLLDRTTAVSPKHAEPFHVCMCLQRWRSAGDIPPTYRSAGFQFRTQHCFIPLLSHSIPL